MRRCVVLAAAVLLAAGAPARGAPAAEPISKRLETCSACHGPKGESQLPETPSLGGQPSFFVATQLFLFREGRRPGGPMTEIAKQISDDDLRSLSEAIAKLPPPAPPSQAPDAARFARGQATARNNHCMGCHGADFSGGEQVPRLANQREDYLLKVLREFKGNARVGYGPAMSEALTTVREEDLPDLAHFLAHVPPPAGGGRRP